VRAYTCAGKGCWKAETKNEAGGWASAATHTLRVTLPQTSTDMPTCLHDGACLPTLFDTCVPNVTSRRIIMKCIF
jgi:hypothetical protein